MKPFVTRLLGVAIGAAIACASASALAADITGAGATFPAPIYVKWAEDYKAKTGIGLNYQAIGSGGGIAQIKAKTVDFGASDKPLSPGELAAAGLTQFPTVIGGVVPVVNIPGVKAGEMVLDGATLAEICLGKIAYWDDGAIKKLNPSLNLPHLAIATVHRADGSGTNFIFTNYLSKMSPQWASRLVLRRLSNGRQALARRAMKAWPATSSNRREHWAMSNLPTPCRTTSPMSG